jgi:excinuclease ABC subunit C
LTQQSTASELISGKLATLPASPGVYLMRDADDRIIYIGKALSLRNRVRSYFGSRRGLDPKTRRLVARIADFEFIVTDTEVEALILENNLIKRHQPRYNVMLRDDKQYLYLKITTAETYPRVMTTRRVVKDGSRYFGPYPNAKQLRQTLKLLNRIFPYRTCRLDMDKVWDRACLKYDIGRCNAPCIRVVSVEEYRRVIDQTINFLDGHHEPILEALETGMKRASAELRFETAASFRDRLLAVRRVVSEQKVMDPSGRNQDVIGIAREGREAIGQVLTIRNGKLIGRNSFRLTATGDEPMGELISEFVREYYGRSEQVPKQVLLPAEIDDLEVVSEWLSSMRDGRVEVRAPNRGALRRLVKLAEVNARDTLEVERKAFLTSERRVRHALRQIGESMELRRLPRRIECYDISHIQGSLTVASMVVFEDGVAKKGKYRRFKIRGEHGNDDFASMREVIGRRFKRMREREIAGGDVELETAGLEAIALEDFDENAALPEATEQTAGSSKEWLTVPDLVLIDGGKGQLSSALAAMQEQGAADVPVAAIAKKREEIFLPGRSRPVLMPAASDGLHLLQRVRDEAHRFAVSFHIKLRTKKGRRSILDEIPGIGPKRKRALIRKYGSVAKIRAAGVDELASLPGMTRSTAAALKEAL